MNVTVNHVMSIFLPSISWFFVRKYLDRIEIYQKENTKYIYHEIDCSDIGMRIQRRAIIITSLMMAWSLCAVVLTNAYTGNMLSHLLIRHHSSTINSLEELLASSLSWVSRRGSYAETLFAVTTVQYRTVF